MFEFLFYSENVEENYKLTIKSLKIFCFLVVFIFILVYFTKGIYASILSMLILALAGVFEYLCAKTMRLNPNKERVMLAYKKGKILRIIFALLYLLFIVVLLYFK